MTALATVAPPSWREPTLLDLTGDTAADRFLQVIRSVPSRTQFTVNDLRARLDAADIPNQQRGGLMAAAVAARLIEVVTVTAWGVTYDVRVPSTGPSAHRATVRVYRRHTPTETNDAGGAA